MRGKTRLAEELELKMIQIAGIGGDKREFYRPVRLELRSTPWAKSFCPLPLLYPSASDFQFRYAPVTVGSGRKVDCAYTQGDALG